MECLLWPLLWKNCPAMMRPRDQFDRKMPFYQYRDFKYKWSHCCLIFIMGIAILVRSIYWIDPLIVVSGSTNKNVLFVFSSVTWRLPLRQSVPWLDRPWRGRLGLGACERSWWEFGVVIRGLLKLRSLISPLWKVLICQRYRLSLSNHDHICQVSLQLSYGDTCQI